MWLNSKQTMSKKYIYSKEWLSLFDSASIYQKKLELFFRIEKDDKLRDLRNALKDRESQYYALKVIENLSNELIHGLLHDLINVIFYSNVSNSYSAKKIILASNRNLFREEIYKIVTSYSENENCDVIKEIALFLYDLKFKKELLSFIESNLFALKESEFIENEQDMKEINDMEDWDDK